MATFTKFRNPKTGRFESFKSNEKQIREIYLTKETNKKIASSTGTWKSKNIPDKIILINFSGKRIPAKPGTVYDKGVVYHNGVKMFNLLSQSKLTKEQMNSIDKFLKQRREDKEDEFWDDVEDFIEDELYESRYSKYD